MSLDDLLPLLFVAGFVVNALIQGRRRSRRGRGAGRRPGGSEARGPAREAASGPDASASTAQDADASGSDASPADDLQRRIEEARRRVREAMGEEADAPRPEADPDAGRTAPEPPRRGPSADAGPARGSSTPDTGGLLGREGLPMPEAAPTPPPHGFLGREGVRSPPPDAVRGEDRHGPQVTRLGHAARSAKLRAAKGLGADRDDIVRGFVWSVVFDEPAAHRIRRRTVSPRRSP